MSLELRQIRAFLGVVDEGHFGRAAARLNLTQPALSQRIQSLERELGVRVLHRSAREVRLTEAGTLLLPYARSLARVEDRAQLELSDHLAGIGGRLRIAYLGHSGVVLPSQIVVEFRRRFPTVEVETSTDQSGTNLERVASGKLDAAFVASPLNVPGRVVLRRLRYDPLVLALSESNPLAALDPVPVTALNGERLIFFPTAMNPGFLLSLERWLVRHAGAPLNIVGYDPPDEAIEALAGSTSGVYFVSEARSAFAPGRGVVYRHMAPSPLGEMSLAYSEDDPTPTVSNLLRIIDELVGSGPGDVPAGSERIAADGA